MSRAKSKTRPRGFEACSNSNGDFLYVVLGGIVLRRSPSFAITPRFAGLLSSFTNSACSADRRTPDAGVAAQRKKVAVRRSRFSRRG
eukprot:5327247-Prymnesium_polylepis.1